MLRDAATVIIDSGIGRLGVGRPGFSRVPETFRKLVFHAPAAGLGKPEAGDRVAQLRRQVRQLADGLGGGARGLGCLRGNLASLKDLCNLICMDFLCIIASKWRCSQQQGGR